MDLLLILFCIKFEQNLVAVLVIFVEPTSAKRDTDDYLVIYRVIICLNRKE